LARAPDLIVVWRQRQNFDLIVYAADASVSDFKVGLVTDPSSVP
jgi:hypothetical protein